MSKRKSPIQMAYEARRTIEAMNLTSSEQLTEDMVQRIIAAFKGDRDAWYLYDTKFDCTPGFWAARSIRNSPKWSDLLFASFR